MRIGRKTHAVDIADAGRKAEYVALSNSVIGILLLVVGSAVGALLALGAEVGLAALTGMSLLGAAMALTMKNAQS